MIHGSFPAICLAIRVIEKIESIGYCKAFTINSFTFLTFIILGSIKKPLLLLVIIADSLLFIAWLWRGGLTFARCSNTTMDYILQVWPVVSSHFSYISWFYYGIAFQIESHSVTVSNTVGSTSFMAPSNISQVISSYNILMWIFKWTRFSVCDLYHSFNILNCSLDCLRKKDHNNCLRDDRSLHGCCLCPSW